MLAKKLAQLGLAVAVVIVVFALLALSRVVVPFWQARENLINPVAPKQYSTVDKQHQVRLRLLQPGLAGFKSVNQRHYLLVTYPQDNRWLIAAVFISGELQPGRVIDKIVYDDKASETQIVSFSQLKSKLKTGEQIGIEYLEEVFAADGDEPVCDRVYPICLLNEILAKSQEFLAADFSRSILKPAKFYTALRLYSALTE